MPPFPNLSRTGLTFDVDLSPTDLNIDHLLIKDHLLTKFEACGGKAFLSYQLHNVWETNMTFELDLLTCISIGIILSSWTIHQPSMKIVGQSVLELSVAQGEVDWHDLWPWPLTYISIGIIYSSRTIYLPSLKLLAERSWVISCTRLRETDIQTDPRTDRNTDGHVQSNMPLLIILRTGTCNFLLHRGVCFDWKYFLLRRSRCKLTVVTGPLVQPEI